MGQSLLVSIERPEHCEHETENRVPTGHHQREKLSYECTGGGIALAVRRGRSVVVLVFGSRAIPELANQNFDSRFTSFSGHPRLEHQRRLPRCCISPRGSDPKKSVDNGAFRGGITRAAGDGL